MFRPVNQQSASRFLLWIDEVGSYLVCRSDCVRIGQAAPGSAADIPLLADLSRHHATIRRTGSGYLLEAVRDAALNGKKVDRLALLTDGAVIELGQPETPPGRRVKIRFRQPHALSSTARLEFVSGHPTQPPATGALLLADACVLGPGEKSHVVCRRWRQEVVLYRDGAELFCRSAAPLTISDEAVTGRGRLTLSSRVDGEDFGFTLEQA